MGYHMGDFDDAEDVGIGGQWDAEDPREFLTASGLMTIGQMRAALNGALADTNPVVRAAGNVQLDATDKYIFMAYFLAETCAAQEAEIRKLLTGVTTWKTT